MEEFHPSRLPVCRTFDVRDEGGASDAADEIVRMGFEGRRDAFKVLMPKEAKMAKRIGYTLTTSVNVGLRRTGQRRSVRYWTYHHDDAHYAIVLVDSDAVGDLDF